MHRALLLYEILSNIISYITIDDRPGVWPVEYVTSSTPTLFAIALTCRAFSEQALDALWNNFKGVEPLMRCAGIIPAPQKRRQEDRYYPIILTEAQLDIIARYAHRIRSLEVGMDYWQPDYITQSFLRTIGGSSKVLTPNLRSLQIGRGLVHVAPPLLGLHLQHLLINISDHRDDYYLDAVFQCLPSYCPSLESLTVSKPHNLFRERNAPFVLPLSHAIQKMSKLRTVDVPTITKDALAYLGGLPSIVDICLQLPTGSDLEYILGSSRGPNLFENVDSIDLEIRDWPDVEVFTRLWPRKLTSITLRSEAKFDPSLLQGLCGSLHVREAFKNLQYIHLSEPIHCRLSSNIVITIDTIRPLFYLRQLRVVDIDTRSCLSISANDLLEMAEAWHYLEVLLLNKTDGSMSGAAPVPQWVTVTEVVKFVELRPSLKQLCIGITLSTVDYDYDMDKASLHALKPRDSDSRLEFLTLRYPHDEEYIRTTYSSEFGILFSKLFPRVKQFHPLQEIRILHPDSIISQIQHA
ncbi:uncharacterized protein EDB93DRAFT_1247830 [Suillus bovinus]|uniref:uncharacterized protein n=1 Tax=Suillus bovinus TaxID=48563 RepID=UPI001B886FE0|nr:uncharacterized protein EDB93DRAFT_1247830 [Suillus bovinus]KAG2155348.1 hypothetical protein EDB93DRAFT_1247830 [Suillus bovinus]